MHLSSKIRRCLNNIDAFLVKPYPKEKEISYRGTHSSLRHYQNVLQGHLSKGPRKENSKGSHYIQCYDESGHCRCLSENQIILSDIEMAQRLMRGM